MNPSLPARHPTGFEWRAVTCQEDSDLPPASRELFGSMCFLVEGWLTRACQHKSTSGTRKPTHFLMDGIGETFETAIFNSWIFHVITRWLMILKIFKYFKDRWWWRSETRWWFQRVFGNVHPETWGKPLFQFPMGRWISPGFSLHGIVQLADFCLLEKDLPKRICGNSGHCTRWAPTSCKWGYNPYKWPYKWVTGAITPINGL